jgi:hypothetical protein
MAEAEAVAAEEEAASTQSSALEALTAMVAQCKHTNTRHKPQLLRPAVLAPPQNRWCFGTEQGIAELPLMVR